MASEMARRLIALTAVIVGMVALLAAAGAVDGGQTGAGQIFTVGLLGFLALVGGIKALAWEEE